MSSIKDLIGEDLYNRLDSEANTEVSIAMSMELVDQWRKERYYTRRPLLTTLIPEFRSFEDKGLKISPLDVVGILFSAKLLYATDSKKEYEQRTGGASFFQEEAFTFFWSENAAPYDQVVERHLELLKGTIIERTLATQLSNFNTDSNMGSHSDFLDELCLAIEKPFEFFFDEEPQLLLKYKAREPSLSEHNMDGAKTRFTVPSATYTTVGSASYVYFYAVAQLRTFLDMLRIAGFLYRGQIDFGMWEVVMMAPSTPFLHQPGVMGGSFSWDEDTKKPWERIPDGCLFLSFGYRGLTKLFLDSRTFGGIKKFYMENNIILDKLNNPWTKTCIEDIAPALEILSSATQTPDLGAKILQIYCCLEHLFVPKNVRKDNVKYIIGAINALRPDLGNWFERLYQVRCDYAHNGFVQRDDKTLSLVFESVQNTVTLLTAKLKQA